MDETSEHFDISCCFCLYGIVVIGLFPIGPYFMATGCDPENYPDNCLHYDIFNGYIYNVIIQESFCSDILETTICYTGLVYASSVYNNEFNICKAKMIGPSTSFNDVNTKMLGYEYGQEVYWIDDGHNECHYPNVENKRFNTGLNLTIYFGICVFIFISIIFTKLINFYCCGRHIVSPV